MTAMRWPWCRFVSSPASLERNSRDGNGTDAKLKNESEAETLKGGRRKMQTRNDRCAPCYGRRANAPVSESHAQMTPGLSSMGEGRCAPDRFCLRQQTTATLATAGLLWPANARCKVRPFLKKKKGVRFSAHSARNSFPSSRKVTPCHHLPRIKRF
jgi:hypothetical protein